MSQIFASILLRTTVVLVRLGLILYFSPHASILRTSSRRPDTKSVSKTKKGIILYPVRRGTSNSMVQIRYTYGRCNQD